MLASESYLILRVQTVPRFVRACNKQCVVEQGRVLLVGMASADGSSLLVSEPCSGELVKILYVEQGRLEFSLSFDGE